MNWILEALVRVASAIDRRGARALAAATVGAAVLVVAAGCNFISPQRTTQFYDASDGTSVTVGDVKVLNALALTEDGAEASLVMSIVNSGDDAAQVSFQYETESGDETQTVDVDANSQVDLGTEVGQEQFVMSDLDVTPGALLPVFVQYGTETGKSLQVPVLTGELSEYATLLPMPGETTAPSAESTTLPSPEDGTPSATPTP
ncbi:hypothetical protein [Frigoribacterium endophyticum]|uniref:hypothetical protein n=1 Tax=Frigoribacterium endophyticum TaxID=1522176 RepID=UPI0014222E68|nr:hypothetical protein [Frigoribacterium endophyticum]NII51696.1 hypothetical protein [Frigoribacterium endophyticum]